MSSSDGGFQDISTSGTAGVPLLASVVLDTVIEFAVLCSITKVVLVVTAACAAGCLSRVSETGVVSEILSGKDPASKEGNGIGLEVDGWEESREGNDDCCALEGGEGAANGGWSTDCTSKGCESSGDFSGTVELPAGAIVGNELKEFVRVGGFDAVLDLNGTPVFQVNVVVGICGFVD